MTRTRCLLCLDEVHCPELHVTFTIATSTGRLSVDVDVCIDCSHTRRVTMAELLEVARRRAKEVGHDKPIEARR